MALFTLNVQQLLIRKRRDSGSDNSVSTEDGNSEITADRVSICKLTYTSVLIASFQQSYSHRIKIRVIQDPQLRLQNNQVKVVHFWLSD